MEIFPSVFPNPANDYIVLNVSNDAVITIINSTGVKEESTYVRKGNTSLQLDKYSSGVYFLSVSSGKEKRIVKIVVE